MKIFLAGQVGFYNRGCEALVRSIVQAMSNRVGACEFVVPSNDVAADRLRWPEAADQGVRFIPFYRIPDVIKWWDRLARRMPSLPEYWWPLPDLPADMALEIESADLVIVTGGDVISLDYGGASLLRWVAQVEHAIRRKIPAALWASSVGPFTENPAIERRMVQHLGRYCSLSTRESHSQAYLTSLGLCPVQTADPAFLMQVQPAAQSAEVLPPVRHGGMLGFNVSPLMARARARAGGLEKLEQDILDFLRQVVDRHGMSIALIPHVDPPDASGDQSDTAYMRDLLARVGPAAEHIRLVPHTFNARQLKDMLSKCRFFIGARTHATIGALSTGVPTVSIAYSVKAKGINQDLFGDLRYMIDTPAVSIDTLNQALDRLMAEEAGIRALLATRMPEVRQAAQSTAGLIVDAMHRSAASTTV